ncbi:MAG: ATP-grasp domain-containing protein [Thermoleophilaceae bacterium]
MRALIFDGRDARASLGGVRALAAGGWEVDVAAPGPTLAGASRHVRRRHPVPLPEDGLDAFLDALAAAIGEGGHEVLFVSSDSDMLVVGAERERIPALVPYPDVTAMRRCMDKVLLSEAASRVGLAAPPVASSAEEAVARFAGGRPVIVKERLHGSVGAGGRPTHVDPLITTDPGEVARRVAKIEAAGAVPMIQPAVSGTLMAFSSVVDGDGRMLARVQQEAERTWPDGLGCSVRARTVAVDPGLADRVAALLRELGWHGLSELQFLVPDAGEPQLIDFNGRFYGSLSLALAAGVNMPDLWARLATGRAVSPAGDARPGLRYQWLEGDLRAVREGAGSPLGSLRYAVGAQHSVSDLRDPKPALHRLRALVAERRGR